MRAGLRLAVARRKHGDQSADPAVGAAVNDLNLNSVADRRTPDTDRYARLGGCEPITLGVERLDGQFKRRGHGRGLTQTAPSSPNSFFQIGQSSLMRSIA